MVQKSISGNALCRAEEKKYLSGIPHWKNVSVRTWYRRETGTGRWFSKAAAKEHKYALYSLGMLYLQGKGVEQDEETAYSLLFRSYSKGNPYAAYELGKLYETGCGTEKNQEKSENCYRVAFLGFLNLEKRSKDDTLWYRIGCMYLHGIGTEADETKAEHYLTKASDYGNTHASYQLARLYIRQESQKLSGESGTAPDYAKIAKAVKWLEESAAQENPFADYAIGRLYREGTLVAEDMEKAVFHLKRAANARNSYAQYQLGKIYLEEDTKNIPVAIQYLTLAAKQKNQFAAYRLGKLYLAGEELPKNTELALHYLKMAADTENQYAQYALGKGCPAGQGTGIRLFFKIRRAGKYLCSVFFRTLE